MKDMVRFMARLVNVASLCVTLLCLAAVTGVQIARERARSNEVRTAQDLGIEIVERARAIPVIARPPGGEVVDGERGAVFLLQFSQVENGPEVLTLIMFIPAQKTGVQFLVDARDGSLWSGVIRTEDRGVVTRADIVMCGGDRLIPDEKCGLLSISLEAQLKRLDAIMKPSTVKPRKINPYFQYQ